MRVDVDGCWQIAERIADKSDAGLMFANGRLALAVKDRIEQSELPRRRCLVGKDAIASAVEVQVFRFISNFGQGGEARSDAEVHVAEISMLRHVKAYTNGGRVAVADLEIDIAHGRIERPGIGVGDGVIGRHAIGRWKGNAAAAWSRALARPRTGEDDHHAHALLKPRRIVSQQEDGPGSAIAEQAHARPYIESAGQAVAA